MKTKKFFKYNSRSIPLITCEYWDQAESSGISQLTDGAIKYTTLFLYRQNQGTDIYYEDVDWGTEDRLLIYVSKRRKRIKSLFSEYLKECREIKKLSNEAQIKNFNRLFQLISSAWIKLCFIIPLGDLLEADKKNLIAKKALAIRKQTANVMYSAADSLIKIIKKIVPKENKNYAEFLTFTEVNDKSLPSLTELAQRKCGYIYYQGGVFSNPKIKNFEMKNKLKIFSESDKAQPKKFLKSYNRFIPLIAADYWNKAETNGIARLTDGKIQYTPLFIYRLNQGTDIYYEDIDWKIEEKIIPYFQNRQKKFNALSAEYLKECREIEKLSKKSDPKTLTKLFRLISSAWPKLSIIVPLGDSLENGNKSLIAKRSLTIREQTANVMYSAADCFIRIIKKIVPKSHQEYANFLTYQEVKSNNLPPLNNLKLRKRGYIYYQEKIFVNLSVHDFEKMFNAVINDDLEGKSAEKNKLIKGMTAMSGKVIGRVIIIKERQDLKKVKKGGILVSSMTTTVPDCLLAMDRAAAFVTDEGGITCHAAIVAREMKKPCVIGTNNATRVLKNNDLVEVDANKGIVRILK